MALHNSAAQEFESVVEVVRRWPASTRLALVEEILKTLCADVRARLERGTWSQASGMLARSGTTPTDEEVEQMLDKSRSEKHE